jgi:NAD-dependent deacetylase
MEMRQPSTDLERAAALVRAARRGLAFTGAGVSAESGIRTFRGQDGLWKRHDPIKTASLQHFLRDPSVYWTVSREGWPAFERARPNPGHHALAALEATGHLAGVVTQNTDGLHRAAGTEHLVELHGSGRVVRCHDCGAIEPRAEVQARLGVEMPPICRVCGGRHLKPTVVFFGEGLPPSAIEEAFELARACDMILVVGSSLQVYPAAEVPRVAVERGAPLVVVNDEPTPMDIEATVVLQGRSGEILPALQALALVGTTDLAP